MKCPTIEEVEANKDNQQQLAIWYRFVDTYTEDDIAIMNKLCEYFQGFNSSLSKFIGWEEKHWL